MSTKSGYVYFIRILGTDFYQVGLSTKHPGVRLKEINQEQNPFEVALVHEVHVRDRHKAKKYFRDLCQKHRHDNQWFQGWFKIPEEAAKKIVEEMHKYQEPKNDQRDRDSTWMLLIGAIFLFFLIAAVGKHFSTTPLEHKDCVAGGGGQACERYL